MQELYKKDFLALLLLTIFAIFALGFNFDISAASLFYYADAGDNPWTQENAPLWRFFYYGAPIITAGVLFPSIFIYVTSFIKERFLPYRHTSLFFILLILIGPGLVINSGFKPFWGRPRPRQVVEFGGQKQFLPYYKPGTPGNGMSFPAGHPSVGFMLGGLYFILRKRREKLAQGAFILSLVIGGMMGVGRMAAGAHFLSDVVWSGLMVYWVGFLLHYHILRLPEKTTPQSINPKRALQVGAGLSTMAFAGVMLATPYQKTLNHTWPNQASFNINIDKADVELVLIDEPNIVRMTAQIRGFGLPFSKTNEQNGENTYKLFRQGPFTDYEAQVKVYVSRNLENFELILSQGGSIASPTDTPPHFELRSEKF